MPIGVFAQESGITSSALRFYADSGLLEPAEIDPSSGYRRYSSAQIPRAQSLRQLREIGMPLTTVNTVLTSNADEASQLIDGHIAALLGAAAHAQRTAAVVKTTLFGGKCPTNASLRGPIFASAVDQILTAAARDRDMPVLSGLRLEVTPEAIVLTSTCRFLLATRTIVPTEKAETSWAATINGDDLRAAVLDIRHCPHVQIEATEHGIRLLSDGREVAHCRVLSDDFPDYRRMLRNLPTVTNRVTIAKGLLQRALEEHPTDRISLRLSQRGVVQLGRPGHTVEIPDLATTVGPVLDIEFEISALYPAVTAAIGPDVMLDFHGPNHPVMVRSADRGDMTTLAMPLMDAKYTF